MRYRGGSRGGGAPNAVERPPTLRGRMAAEQTVQALRGSWRAGPCRVLVRTSRGGRRPRRSLTARQENGQLLSLADDYLSYVPVSE